MYLNLTERGADMAYKIAVNPEYVHVMFIGKVDMVTLLSVDAFIKNIRRLKRVIYDYTLCVCSDR